MSAGAWLLAGFALVAGSALILVLAVIAAVVVSHRIDPGPDLPAGQEVEAAERFRRERDAFDERHDRMLEARGRERVVGSRWTYPVFATVFVVFMFAGAVSAVVEHAEAGGGPPGLSLVLRPVWLPWIPASIAALVVVADRRRNWERWPQWRKDQEIERERAGRRRDDGDRMERLRRSVSPRRRSKRH